MPDKTPSVILGALVYVVLGTIISLATPTAAGGQGGLGMLVGCLSCLLVMGSGMIAVWHYTNTHQLTLAAGQGVTLGMMSAVLGAITAALIGFLLMTLGLRPGVEEVMDMTIAELEQQGMTDAQIDSAIGITRMMLSPIAMIAMAVISGAIGGAIGGALGAVFFKKGSEVDNV